MDKNEVYAAIDVVQEGNQLRPSLSFSKANVADNNIPLATTGQITKTNIPDEVTRSYRWAHWGGLDDLPSLIRQKINEVPIAGRTIHDLVRMMYGNGLAYYRNEDRRQGNTVKRHYSPAIEDFLIRNHLAEKWVIPQLYDYRHVTCTFSELIFNRRRDQVTNLFHKQAEFSRLSQVNKTTHDIEYLYFSAYFGAIQQPTDEDIQAIPLYRWYDEENFFSRLSGHKIAWQSVLETPGRIYYPTPPWLGLFRDNGWMDASKAVPEVVNSMMRNQIVLKYQILIPESYFTIRYRDSWGTLTDVERQKIIDGLVSEIDNNLSGTDNAYMSIATIFNYDSITKTELGKIQIIAIDDKIKKDSWVPSSEKSDAQVVQGLGGHPSQVGLAPEGGKMGAGSGSDKREVFNIEISNNTLDQQVILGPLNWIARFNAKANPEWDVTFFFDHTRHTTTNKQEDGMDQDTDTNIVVE